MKHKLEAIRVAVNKALKEVEAEHNVSLELGNIRYNSSTFTSKIEGTFLGDGTKEDKEKEDFKALMVVRGHKDLADYYGKQIQLDNQVFKVVGCKPRSPKNCIVIQSISNHKEYITSVLNLSQAKLNS